MICYVILEGRNPESRCNQRILYKNWGFDSGRFQCCCVKLSGTRRVKTIRPSELTPKMTIATNVIVAIILCVHYLCNIPILSCLSTSERVAYCCNCVWCGSIPHLQATGTSVPDGSYHCSLPTDPCKLVFFAPGRSWNSKWVESGGGYQGEICIGWKSYSLRMFA